MPGVDGAWQWLDAARRECHHNGMQCIFIKLETALWRQSLDGTRCSQLYARWRLRFHFRFHDRSRGSVIDIFGTLLKSAWGSTDVDLILQTKRTLQHGPSALTEHSFKKQTTYRTPLFLLFSVHLKLKISILDNADNDLLCVVNLADIGWLASFDRHRS